MGSFGLKLSPSGHESSWGDLGPITFFSPNLPNRDECANKMEGDGENYRFIVIVWLNIRKNLTDS